MPPVIVTDVIDSEVNLNIIVTNFTGSLSLSASNYNAITLGPFFKKGTYVSAEHRKKNRRFTMKSFFARASYSE